MCKFFLRSYFIPDIYRERQLAEGGIGVGEGAKSYDSEKACSSINHTILSAF
jgi:hypothetical protein